MRKLIMILTGVCLLALAGCSGKENKKTLQGDSTGEKKQEATKGVGTSFASEDYNPGNNEIWKTEKGYYYYSYEYGGFRYVDAATGMDMFLCNKPECKHDGNAFCVATNDKYLVIGGYLYNGRIIVNAIEETDTQYQYKLLEIALDGSMANEIVTYFTLEKTGISSLVLHGGGGIYVHRNKVLLPLSAGGQNGLEDNELYGAAIVDLNTKEVTYLDEEPLSKDNAGVTDVDAYGDYLYYCRAEGKKIILHRYNINDGTDETHKLLVGFRGKYAVPDSEHVVYLKSGQELCVHYYATGENEEKLRLMGTKIYGMPDGTTYEDAAPYTAVNVVTDGDYYYVAEQSYSLMFKNPKEGEPAEKKYRKLHVYNREFEEVLVINLADVMSEMMPEAEGEIYGDHTRLRYIGEKLYWTLSDGVDTEYIFSCRKSDLLAGTPKFEPEYSEPIN